MKDYKKFTIGPMVKEWKNNPPKGDCPECGSQCSPTCGMHPNGCIFGGFTEQTSYWLIADGCELYHGE